MGSWRTTASGWLTGRASIVTSKTWVAGLPAPERLSSAVTTTVALPAATPRTVNPVESSAGIEAMSERLETASYFSGSPSGSVNALARLTRAVLPAWSSSGGSDRVTVGGWLTSRASTVTSNVWTAERPGSGRAVGRGDDDLRGDDEPPVMENVVVALAFPTDTTAGREDATV